MQPQAPGPSPIKAYQVSDESPKGARAEEARTASETLADVGLPGAVISVRHGPRLLVAQDGVVREIADVDPARGTALTMGETGAPVEIVLHWLMAQAFPDDDAFLQARIPGEDREDLVARARGGDRTVATEVARGHDMLETQFHALRASKDHDVVASRTTGVLLRGPDAGTVVDDLVALLGGEEE